MTIEAELLAERKAREAIADLEAEVQMTLSLFDPSDSLKTAEIYNRLVGQAEARVTLALGAWCRAGGGR